MLNSNLLVVSILSIAGSVLVFTEHSLSKEAVRGEAQNSRSRGISPKGQSTPKANTPVGEVISSLKNEKLKKDLEDRLVPCLKRILKESGNMPNATDDFVRKSCRMANMGNCRDDNASFGAKDSCHKNKNGCQAVDIGRIECGWPVFKLVPASESDGNKYFLELAKCMSGNIAKNGSISSGKRAGVCYHDPCAAGENTVGKCKTVTHVNHIHFSNETCGGKEHQHFHKKPKAGGASCNKSAQNEMPKG